MQGNPPAWAFFIKNKFFLSAEQGKRPERSSCYKILKHDFPKHFFQHSRRYKSLCQPGHPAIDVIRIASIQKHRLGFENFPILFLDQFNACLLYTSRCV